MKLTPHLFLLLALLSISCEDDDGPTPTPARDRGEEAIAAQLEIEDFLQTHFYNYEAFENPSTDFDFKIVIDTIAGDNSNKTALIDQVDFKTVKDRIDEDVSYKLYYLEAIQGVGDSPDFPDIAIVAYEGRLLNGELFDSSTVPIGFDLTGLINGFQDVLQEFNGAGNIIKNNDGTVSFEDFGVGAAFLPSGLGYFNIPPQGIGSYDQLIFTFSLFEAQQGDQDQDGVLSIHEDVNNNEIEEDDDTDSDGTPNFADNDDDGDGDPTIDEIKDEDGNVITDPDLYPDSDGDGIVDYLDSDS